MRLSYSLVLTGAPGTGAVTGPLAAEARSLLDAGAIFEDRWLGEGEAWQALFTAGDTVDMSLLRGAIERALASEPVDVNIIPDDLAFTRRKLLVADMESTIIEAELLDEIAARAGLGEKVKAITARAMKGEIEFEDSLRERVALLAGLDAAILSDVFEANSMLMPGAETLVRTMRANGAVCALVSGGFTIFTEPVRDRAGFHIQQANVLEIDGGRLTGRVKEPILGRAAKRDALLSLCREQDLDPVMALAVGDGANDLDMIGSAGLGVAFRAKPKVQAAARALPTGAVITHGDLTALLYLQGYRLDEFAS